MLIKLMKSERIYLREIETGDWIDVHAYASQEIVCQYQPWGPNSEQDSREYVEEIIANGNVNPRSRFAFAVVEMQTEKMIGVGEFTIRDFSNKVGEIAYIVNPDHWGKGFATEVAKLLINFGFSEFGMHRIFATCDPRNLASSKVLEKVGMTQEGRLREDLLLRDGWRDSFVYGILENEWSWE